MTVAARAESRQQASLRVRAMPVRAVPVRAALGAIMVAGAALHVLLAWLRVTPNVFPDEYLYASLGGSLAATGRPAVRGSSAHFPALLEPILTAPVWLVHDMGLAYRLLQLENGLVVSLAAIPAYLMARRLDLGRWTALGIAALSLTVPQLLFAGMILSEPFAYPLVLGALAAALALLDRPSSRAQLVFVLLAGLAAFARLQFVVLPFVVLGAAIVVGLRERRLRAALREQRLLVSFSALAAAGAALVATRGLGYYGHLPLAAPPVRAAARLAVADAYVVLLSAGAVLAPAALVGWWLAIARPRSRTESRFAVLVAIFAAALLVESVLYGHANLNLVQERYLFYLEPLVPMLFALRLSRPRLDGLAELSVALVLAAVAAGVPLLTYAVVGAQSESPFLFGVDRLVGLLGHPNHIRVVLAAIAGSLFALGALATVRARIGGPIALVLAGVVALAAFAAGASFDRANNRALRRVELGPDPQWVDRAARGGDVSMLVTYSTQRHAALATLFWNPSIVRVARLADAPPIDKVPEPRLRIARDGTLLVGRAPLRGRLLVEDVAQSIGFANGVPQARVGGAALYRSPGRLAWRMSGRAVAGFLAPRGGLSIWSGEPQVRGWLTLRLSASRGSHGATFTLAPRGGSGTLVRLSAGRTTDVRFRVCGRAPWHGTFATGPASATASEGPLLVQSSTPRFVSDAAACS